MGEWYAYLEPAVQSLPMNESSRAPQALALVLEADMEVAAVLSLQLELLGLESRYHRHSSSLLEEVVRRPPQLVICLLYTSPSPRD